MTTLVGKQSNFETALKELLELDYDAVEAYEAAIHRLKSEEFKDRLREFKSDHQRHIKELSALLRNHNIDPPNGPSGKQWLTKGKVVLANIMGDKAILEAMNSNEDDTNMAYDRMNGHKDKWPDSADIIHRGLIDERRHKAWMEQACAHTNNAS